ncbi:MAG: cell division protein ZapE [Neisseriaceae bacterium]|nr:MAG: cell division protein ZapE [Neisseriaceae bacterium]
MSENRSFIVPSYVNKSPLTWYREASKQDSFIVDQVQENAIIELDRLWHAILDYRKKTSSTFKKIIFSTPAPNGIYMWGGVGRGKSFLMDAFYNCLPFTQKRRVHFHAFMSEVEQKMYELKDQNDPLVEFSKRLAKEIQVLCFDEFHVSDIAHAMILGRLLQTVLDKNLVIVATSNYKPDNLYYQGQNRYSFLPTIDLINTKFKVINVDAGEDYRLRTLTQAGVFLQPDSEENEIRLAAIFERLNTEKEKLDNEIQILGRTLIAKKRTLTSIWFDFKELCFGLRSQQDYLKIAQEYYYVFISGVKKLDETHKDVARRLTWLIDILYDYRVKVCMTSQVDINSIYEEGDFSEEFQRTASRMTEMQSEEYLRLPHLILK